MQRDRQPCFADGIDAPASAKCGTFFWALALLAGCAGTAKTPQTLPQPQASEPQVANAEKRKLPSPVAEPPDVALPKIASSESNQGTITLSRGALRSLVDNFGAQRFIGLIDVRPAFRSGRFFGWRVLGYRGPGKLNAGDIIIRVNGRSLERPQQFMNTWRDMPDGKVLVIEIQRGKRRLRFAYAIVD